jgi:cobyrinic acid a,c-diamide synthase
MVGVIDSECEMYEKPIGRGYTLLQKNSRHPWPNISEQPIPGHEFHYSKLARVPDNIQFAFGVDRGFGVDGRNDGILYKNLLACYTHQRNTQQNQWISSFIEFAKTCG